jgi:putative thioredoxin
MAAGPLAMDELLEIIMRDKQWNEAAPRKTFVAILELLTPPKPKAGEPIPGKTAGGIELRARTPSRKTRRRRWCPPTGASSA